MKAELIRVVEHLQTKERKRIVDPLIAAALLIYRKAWAEQKHRAYYTRGRAMLPFLSLSPLLPVMQRAYIAGTVIAESSLLGPTIIGLSLSDFTVQNMAADLDRTSTVLAGRLVDAELSSGATAEEITDQLINLIGSWESERAATAAEWSVSTALHQGMQDYVDKFIASSQGVLVLKRWSVNPGACEICVGNAADGWIDSEITFASGSDTAPEHPNCSCSIDYKTSID